MKKIIQNITSCKKDTLGCLSTTQSLNSIQSDKITVKGIVEYTEDEKDIMSFVTDKGYINSISVTVKECIENMLTVFENKDVLQGIAVKIIHKKSRKGREFLLLELI